MPSIEEVASSRYEHRMGQLISESEKARAIAEAQREFFAQELANAQAEIEMLREQLGQDEGSET